MPQRAAWRLTWARVLWVVLLLAICQIRSGETLLRTDFSRDADGYNAHIHNAIRVPRHTHARTHARTCCLSLSASHLCRPRKSRGPLPSLLYLLRQQSPFPVRLLIK